MNNGYSICLNKWAIDKELKNELGLLLIISSLCAEKGFCYASNEYLANVFEITEISVSTKLKKLKELGYITIEYEKRGCEVISRKIRLKNFLTDDLKKIKPTIKENLKDNNTSINNTSINNKKKYIKKSFTPPTLEEVEEYCKKRKNNINPKTFYDWYNENNWIDNNGKEVKNWKGKVITWESHDEDKKKNDKKKNDNWMDVYERYDSR